MLSIERGSTPATAINQDEFDRMLRALRAFKAQDTIRASCRPAVDAAAEAARVFGPIFEWFMSGDTSVYDPRYPYIRLAGGWIDIRCADYGIRDQYGPECEVLADRIGAAIEAAASPQAEDPDLAPLIERYAAVVPAGFGSALRSIEAAVQCRPARWRAAPAVAILGVTATTVALAVKLAGG